MVSVKSIKTLEFKAYLTPDQKKYVDDCLDKLRVVWNIALNKLEEFSTFTGYYCKETESYLPCCPIQYEYRYYWLDGDGNIIKQPTETDKAQCERILAPFSRIVSEQSRWYIKKMTRVRIPQRAEGKDSWGWKGSNNCTGHSCPIRQVYREPLLKSHNWKGAGGLSLAIKKENIDSPRFDFLLEVAYKFRAGTISSLSTSWQEYEKTRMGMATQKRGMPKYKKAYEGLDTLIHPNPRGIIKPDVNQKDRLIGIPILKSIKVKGLDRWRNLDGSIPDVATFKIVRRPSGYYVQLTGEIEYNHKVKPSDKAVGIDPGLHSLIATDGGKLVQPPKFFRKAEKRLKRLQRKLARKTTKRALIWLNSLTVTDVDTLRDICPSISKKNASKLLNSLPIKTEKEAILIIGASSFNTLKYHRKSNREQKLKGKISRRHEKIRMQRRNFHHKLSTYVVRTHGAIAWEDTNLQNLVRRSKAKEKEDGSGYDRNNQKAKSGLNKSFADAGIGMLAGMVETKAKVAGRQFKKVAANQTSQLCPVCDTAKKMPLDVRWYKCDNCGYECDRDVKAGISILQKAEFKDVRLSPNSLHASELREALGRKEGTNSDKAKRPTRKKEKDSASLPSAQLDNKQTERKTRKQKYDKID